MKQQVVVLLSGGLDSTTLTYQLVDVYGAENVHALNFNYNQKHVVEVEKAKSTAVALGINYKEINIDFLGDMVAGVSSLSKHSTIETPTIKAVLGDPQPSTYIPNRNMILASIAASYAEAVEANSVYLAIQQQDLYSYFDTTAEFVKRINAVLQLNRMNHIEVKAPFVSMSKKEIIEVGLSLKVPYEATNTCYNPNEHGESCGKCASCAERIKGFAELQIKDPVPYSIDLDWDELFTKYSK